MKSSTPLAIDSQYPALIVIVSSRKLFELGMCIYTTREKMMPMIRVTTPPALCGLKVPIRPMMSAIVASAKRISPVKAPMGSKTFSVLLYPGIKTDRKPMVKIYPVETWIGTHV